MARKPRDFKAEYARRIARGEAKGKTRQLARGHVVKEHIVRREHERQRNLGLTNEQLKSIVLWYEGKFDPLQYKGFPGVERVVDFSREVGFERFRGYRKTWDRARRLYVKEQASGDYESRGEQYLHELHDLAALRPTEEMSWLYYH
jgi:hypothetical protein